MAVGLDWGTSTVIASRRVPKKDEENKLEIRTREQRNCYLPLLKTDAIMKIVESSKINVVDLGKDDFIYVIGDDAINLANSMGQEVERPMKAGVLQGDLRALRIMQAIANSVLSSPKDEKELVVYSVPANPVDKNMNTMHHKGMAKKALETLGWHPEPIIEGLAVVYANNPVAEIDGQECKFTGIGISCLCPGVKIYTDRGILPIENVEIYDKVITHKGRWQKINNVITKDFSGIMTKIQISGYSNNTEEYKFVDNHEILVKRNGKWNWIGCEEVHEGDIVGEPIINKSNNSNIKFNIYNESKDNDKFSKETILVSPDIQRFFGYFLGSGFINKEQNYIQINIPISNIDYVEDILQIIKKLPEDFIVILKDDSFVNIKYFSKGLSNWMFHNFYDEDLNKKYPFDISMLEYSDSINLLTGLLRTNNYNKDCEDITFINSNTNLIILVKQLLSKINCPAFINYKEDKYNNLLSTTQWMITLKNQENDNNLKYYLNNLNIDNSQLNKDIFIESGFCCGVIEKVEHEEYSGVVYDLQVEEDHSFSGPFLTIHNCGGGMINVCVAYKGLDTLSFSLANALGNNQGSSGDWIDKRLFDAYGNQLGSEARCVIYKENYANLKRIDEDVFSYAEEVASSTNIIPGDVDWHFQVLTSLQIFYENLMDYIIDSISREFEAKKPSLNGALDIIIAGGTSIPEGFEDLFKRRIERKKLPFRVGEIIKANDPKYAVTKGCLAAAEAGYQS